MSKLSKSDAIFIAREYQKNFVKVIDLATHFGVSRVTIYKSLWKSGVSTEKGKVICECYQCGKKFWDHKYKTRKTNSHFCSRTCYYKYLKAGNYIESRQGARKARNLVKKYFNLLDGHIVHHVDCNQLNNSINNLMVFKCQADHLRFHRGFKISPIWEGSKI